ncbi:MAG: hypothetical protein ACLQHS_15815 [Candidatus Limnocylindrales bacterium]|jgi:succinyl-CoA synthetase beta subunit
MRDAVVAPASDIGHDHYAGVVLDRNVHRIVVIGSAQGAHK